MKLKSSIKCLNSTIRTRAGRPLGRSGVSNCLAGEVEVISERDRTYPNFRMV